MFYYILVVTKEKFIYSKDLKKKKYLFEKIMKRKKNIMFNLQINLSKKIFKCFYINLKI